MCNYRHIFANKLSYWARLSFEYRLLLRAASPHDTAEHKRIKEMSILTEYQFCFDSKSGLYSKYYGSLSYGNLFRLENKFEESWWDRKKKTVCHLDCFLFFFYKPNEEKVVFLFTLISLLISSVLTCLGIISPPKEEVEVERCSRWHHLVTHLSPWSLHSPSLPPPLSLSGSLSLPFSDHLLLCWIKNPSLSLSLLLHCIFSPSLALFVYFLYLYGFLFFLHQPPIFSSVIITHCDCLLLLISARLNTVVVLSPLFIQTQVNKMLMIL